MAEAGQAVGTAVEDINETETETTESQSTSTTPTKKSRAKTTIDRKNSIVTINDRKLVVRYKHHYAPHLYAIRFEPNELGDMFDIIPFGMQIPSFAPNLNKDKFRRGNRKFIDDYAAFKSAKEAFDFRHDIFTQEVLWRLRRSPDHQSQPAVFVTQAFLYDYDEWVKNPPTTVTDQETGEKVVIDEGTKPDHMVKEAAFCSISEKNYRKTTGRNKALGRAIQSFIRQYL